MASTICKTVGVKALIAYDLDQFSLMSCCKIVTNEKNYTLECFRSFT